MFVVFGIALPVDYLHVNVSFSRLITSLGENRSSGFPTRFDKNRAVQPQMMARGLKFRI